MAIIHDFKALRDACDNISKDIMGPRADKLLDCPICDRPFNPDEDEEFERCQLCNGTMKASERTLIREGYIEEPEPAIQSTAPTPQAPAPKWPGKAPQAPPNGSISGGSGGGGGGDPRGSNGGLGKQAMPMARLKCPACGGGCDRRVHGWYCDNCGRYVG